ncbi:MAG: sugar transferase [Marinilabiliaceae bacterium]|nr:sugar transferase [Marinilabiliaceae bacterium]
MSVFLLSDILFVTVAAIFSISIVMDDLPVFLTQLAIFIPVPATLATAVIGLSCYYLLLLYLGGVYRKNRNLSKRKQLSDVSGSLIAGLSVLFVFNFGIFELFAYTNAWNTYLQLIIIGISCLAAPRMIITQIIQSLIKKGIWQYDAILVGSAATLKDAFTEITILSNRSGYRISQVLSTDYVPLKDGLSDVTVLSKSAELKQIITLRKPDEIIIALPSFNSKTISEILTMSKNRNITVKILPDITAILEGFVKIDHVASPPFITITNKGLPVWQQIFKRLYDILISIIGILMMLPFFPFIAWKIKKTSPGPIFYLQERIGKNGHPFQMIKFRTMYINAEEDGPSLSSENDQRVTPFGRFLRRWRLDEIPQFANVFKGDMALVGPRPERQHYIDQLLKKTPHFSRLLSVKPGITSMGMVKFGYAENLDQMIKRLRYDMIYMENLSLYVDFKIFLYTLKTLLLGEGK